MPPILPRRPNVYAASPLDRAGARRTDTAWIAASLAAPGALFVPLWRNRNLVTGMEDAQPEAVTSRRRGRRAAPPGPRTPVGIPRPARRGPGVRHRPQRRRGPGPAAARPARRVRRSALSRLGRAEPAGGGARARPRPAALAHPAPLLRRLRRALRAAERRPCDALHRLRHRPFPAHRPGRDHAGHQRRPRPARPFAALPAREHVFDAGRLRRTGRKRGGSRAPRSAGGIRRRGGRRCTTIRASPGRSPATSCSASTARG